MAQDKALGNIIPQPTHSAAVTSPSSSLQSSFNGSSTTRLSQTRPGSSGAPELSQGSIFHEIKTPATSLSNSSSQERMNMANADHQDGLYPVDELGSRGNISSKQAPISRASDYRSEYTSAPKRMANGDLKSPEHSVPTSPSYPSQYGHSRNNSTTSRGSQIGEISTQLKTRLSYAMIKVQNGWQSRNISELECLTADRGSPMSGPPEQQRQHAPPGAFMQPPMPISELPAYSNFSPRKSALNYSPGSHNEADQTSSPLVRASYESFWREHTGSGAPNTFQAPIPLNGSPSLAPPVDILPRSTRRPGSTNTQPPSLRTNDLYDTRLQHIPHTPSPKKPSQTRTPSQQAAVEKDAVESLLFMSSPGNSGYHPPVLLSGTPLRSGVAPETGHVSYSGVLDCECESTVRYSGSQQTQDHVSRRALHDADINKMLDEMPDTSSSDEDDHPTKRPSHIPLVR